MGPSSGDPNLWSGAPPKASTPQQHVAHIWEAPRCRQYSLPTSPPVRLNYTSHGLSGIRRIVKCPHGNCRVCVFIVSHHCWEHLLDPPVTVGFVRPPWFSLKSFHLGLSCRSVLKEFCGSPTSRTNGWHWFPCYAEFTLLMLSKNSTCFTSLACSTF